MLHFIISLLGILITIFFVVGTHEFAHFAAARLLGVKVLRFSIGFGKKIVGWRGKAGTEYVIALVPLGGYVKMLDENEGNVAPHEKHLAFNRQPYYKKFIIVAAGPLTNIFCALIIYWLIFMIGFTTVKPIIGTVNPNSIAAAGGLKPNQEITKVDDKKIMDWGGFILRLIAHAGNQDQVTMETSDENNLTQRHILNLGAWKLDGLTPDPLGSIGLLPFTPDIPLTIGKIFKSSPADLQGLQLNDKVIFLDRQPIKNWETLITTIVKNPDKKIILTVERNKKKIDLPVTIGYKRNILLQKTGYLGIGPHFEIPDNLLRKIKYPPVQAFVHALQQLYNFTYFNFMLVGKLVTGKLSLQSLGGPITIFDTAGTALNLGIISFLGFLAFLSISIGAINLLPIPGLDGGHLVLQTVEWIIQKPVPEKVLGVLYRLGFMLVFFVLFIALMNDLLRL